MKTFSIRTLLILMAVCGFVCWFFFVPAQLTVPVVAFCGEAPDAGQQLCLVVVHPNLKDPDSIFGFPLIVADQQATFVEINKGNTFANIEMSRWDFLWFDRSAAWIVYKYPGGEIWRFNQ